MNTELQIVILSIVALHVAAVVGGGVALGLMRLFGHKPPRLGAEDAGDTASSLPLTRAWPLAIAFSTKMPGGPVAR